MKNESQKPFCGETSLGDKDGERNEGGDGRAGRKRAGERLSGPGDLKGELEWGQGTFCEPGIGFFDRIGLGSAGFGMIFVAGRGCCFSAVEKSE